MSLAALDRMPERDPYSEPLFEAIAQGMEPFRYKTAELSYEFDIDYNRYWVYGEVRLLDGFRIVYKTPFDRDADDPWAVLETLCEKFMIGFRNRDGVRPPDNIHLGEN